MKDKLSKLFEFQRFEKNKDLQKLIDETEERYAYQENLLDEASLSFVAGGKKSEEELKNDKDKEKL